ncbi:Zinc finger, C2H2 type family protein [Trichomonas vaginalis G3]|uniref:Zinc finger, C2H2 type family protein n=1 Tax=Trichomonas vaginalis (strain ATCC PRA-98 / G3) TaxID=412133 RepID=A2FT61_TRIV3|nr:rescue of stalled ribosome [Trichomonas vaginalis G3]EAX91902.1 Zinc finger, C2H2 type family protein [Trichomonas vaginalis G3]KAI5536759.1 rescue of stalled ribosome [Trichomonas vaginalis G3]|eukprot:XP_001304832.1 Zinc finger, C2H2 type family protein [Trichomonas vaginalis G3]
MSSSSIPECDLCSEPIKIRVLQPCNHNNICLQCFIRFNRNYGENHCYFCQNPIEKTKEPIASTNITLSYEAARALNPKFHNQFNIFYTDDSILEALKSLFEFQCPECQLKLPTIELFSSHMKSHKMNVCSICFNSGRYPPEACPIFRKADFYEHLRQHPRCICCNQIFFDTMTLSTHMNQDHIRCKICADLNKVLWFKDANELGDHNKKENFVCTHGDCSANNLIAFSTRGELLIHLQKVHGERNREIDITRDFEGGKVVESPNEARDRAIQLNKKLMTRLNDCFKNDPQSIQKLRVYAKKLIDDAINCEEFYKNFSQICGDKKGLIFCDMIVSLPDARKRSELFRIHSRYTSPEPSKPPQKPKSIISLDQKQNKSPIIPRSPPQQHPTAVPQQVVPPKAQNSENQQSQGGGKKKKPKRIVISMF